MIKSHNKSSYVWYKVSITNRKRFMTNAFIQDTLVDKLKNCLIPNLSPPMASVTSNRDLANWEWEHTCVWFPVNGEVKPP